MRESMFLLASPRIIAESARRISARAVRLSKVPPAAAGVAESAVAGVLFPQPATMAGILANKATAGRLRISPPNRPPAPARRTSGGELLTESNLSRSEWPCEIRTTVRPRTKCRDFTYRLSYRIGDAIKLFARNPV